MHRIAELENSIRSFVNEHDLYGRYFKHHLRDWQITTVSMDVLGDTSAALSSYEGIGFGTGDGDSYLQLYGTLQAVFLQQDSIRQLSRIFSSEAPTAACQSAWFEIRDIRNKVAGHPIDKDLEGRKVSIFVSRVSITPKSFEIFIHDETLDTPQHQRVDFEGLYEKYKAEAVQLLQRIRAAQETGWTNA